MSAEIEHHLNETTAAALEELNRATWEAVAARADMVTGQKVAVPAYQPASTWENESRFSADFPVLRHLPEALALARSGPLAELVDKFEAILPELRWSQNPNYTEANCSRAFLDGYAYAAFSGPQGPIHLEAPRGGFMLMGPNVDYADHSHAPREVYLALTPASWRLDQGEWFEVDAGDLVFHDAWQMHGMRTGATPFLAFAGWVEKGSRLGIGFA